MKPETIRKKIINQIFRLKKTSKELDELLNDVFNSDADKAKKKPEGIKIIGFTPLGYDDIKYNSSGWADAKKYAPLPFDLVELKTKNKTVNGWFKGVDWFSNKLKKNTDVLFWKRTKENFTGGPKGGPQDG